MAAQLPAVRPARPADALKIGELIAPLALAGTLLPRTADELEELIPTSFVAEFDGTLVGFAALEIYSRKLAEIRSLAVLRGSQGHGLGSQLVRACVELARKRNILEVMVVTSSDEFFLSCGFDFTLPGEKKALFIQPTSSPDWASRDSTPPGPASSAEASPS